MGQTEIIAVSIRESEVKRCAELIRDNLHTDNISIEYDSSIRHVPPEIVSQVSDGEKVTDKYQWVNSIEDHVIDGAAQWDHSLYSWRILVDEYRRPTELCIARLGKII